MFKKDLSINQGMILSTDVYDKNLSLRNIVDELYNKNQQEIFNRLTNNGTVRGLFFGNTEQTRNQLYINADYIATGILKSNNYAENATTGKATAGTEIILSDGTINASDG
jgi:hypothetical protein